MKIASCGATLSLSVCLAAFAALGGAPMDVDVLVVGGTTKGILAAKAAKAEGRSVYLVTPHAFLGEDMASTLELGNDAGSKPITPLEKRLWSTIGGLAPFDYYPDRPTDGIRHIFKNDTWNRLSEPGDPPTVGDGVLYIDDITYRCVLRKRTHISKVGVIVLEPSSWISSALMREKDYRRLNKERPKARKVATSRVVLKFLEGPRKGETVELARKGPIAHFDRTGWYSDGPVVLFEGDVGAEIGEAEIKVCVDPAAHHQLVSRIRFHLANAEEVMSPPSPLKVKRTYDSELMEAGVDFITCSPVRRVFRDGSGRMNGVEIVNRSGRTMIRAREVVDATLYGMLGKVPAVAGEESFSRVVIADRSSPSAPGMKVDELPRPFRAAHTELDGKMYRCTFKVPMKDGTFPSFAAAEWEARELTKAERTVDAADLLVWHPSRSALDGAKDVPSGELPVWGEYDVVVVGGGTAGAPAAIAAARGGAKTLVVEFCDILGGVGTDGMVTGYFDGNQVGFVKEFNAACKKSYGLGQYRRAEVWRNMCRAAGATVWFGAMGVGALRDGDKVTGVEVASSLGCGIVRAKCVIDGTGNSDIAAAAGAGTELISAREIAIQSAGQSPQRLGYGGINSDFGYLNDADAKDLWLFSLRARAGAPDAWDIAKLPDSRERRRIMPDLRLSGEDVVANRRFHDTIAQAMSRQDPHGYLTDDFGYLAERSTRVTRGERENRHMFYVNLPLRCTLPKGLSGIAVVGLGAGIERDVVSITRMQADLMNMGYGVGTAAAMAVPNGGDFRKIDFAELRRRLVEKGNLRREALAWNQDDDCSSDAIVAKSVQTLLDGFKGGHVIYRAENRARAIPLLRKAYEVATDAKSRQVYALALGLMGDATGIETLVSVVERKEPIREVRDGRTIDSEGKVMEGVGPFRGVYSHGSPYNGFMLALGRTRDRRAVAPLLAKLGELKPGAALPQVRMITLALEALGDPAAAEPLAKLLQADGMHGYAVKKASDLPPTGGYGIGGEYARCFRELALARALMACGDFKGVARRTYEAYAADPRGLLSAHAKAVVAEGDVLSRFYAENEGRELRRIPSWIVPENAFIGLSNPDFDDPSNATQRRLFEMFRDKSDWNVITYTLRCVPDLSNAEVQRRVAEAAKLSSDMGVELLMDIDPRIMRDEFLSRWPDECLMIRQFANVTPDASGTAKFRIEQDFMQDHMCWGREPYSGWKPGRFVAAYAVKGKDVSSLRRLTADGITSTTNAVTGTVRGLAAGETLLAEAEFSLKAPDPYSPHLLSFTREMMLRYRKLGVHGAMRDEWGFVGPRTSMQAHKAFWYSRPFADAYRRISGGRDYGKDMIAFALGVDTQEAYKCVTCYIRTIYEGCRMTEEDFYAADKEYFGKDVYVAKHATWHTLLGRTSEHLHNGIDWWVAKRDWAQSDESCPVSVDTGMMRKFGTPLWMNEGYGPTPEHYSRSLWQYLLCGGRMVYHGIYGGGGAYLKRYTSASERKYHSQADLLSREGRRAEQIARLLPLMTRAQIDCPVAYVFGHERLVNWLDPALSDWGEPIVHGLGGRGYYSDAFPASEIANGTFTIDGEGTLCVGGHRYLACILYHLSASEMEEWKKFVGGRSLTTRLFNDPTVECVADYLAANNAVRQTPLLETGLGGRKGNRLPPSDGIMTLTDGTVVRVKGGTPDLAGDPISGTLAAGGAEVAYAARGMFAVCVRNGALAGFAGGEVTRVDAPGFSLALEKPADVVLTKIGGEWRGVWQTPDTSEPVPAALQSITRHWVKLRGL